MDWTNQKDYYGVANRITKNEIKQKKKIQYNKYTSPYHKNINKNKVGLNEIKLRLS